jgi:hypothetical protein
MNIQLSDDDVQFAIGIYLALKGMKSTSGNFVYCWNQRVGLKSVTVEDVKITNFDIDKLVECVKNR